MEFLQQILSICGAISIVGGAGAIVVKVIRPAFLLNKRVSQLEVYNDKDYKKLQSLEDMQKQQSKCLAAMLNHQITGEEIMSMELLMQYVMYMLAGIGVLAFFVSVVVQVVKEMPGLNKIQTNVVALAASIVITPIAVVILCMYFGIVITWQYVFASILAAFVVYLVSTGGWEKVSEMWDRSKYNKKNQL